LARKFDPVRNQNIINMIDKELLNENEDKTNKGNQKLRTLIIYY
jgi:hypothetical protein